MTVAAPAAPEFTIPWALLLTTAWLLGAEPFLIARRLEYRAMRVRLLCGAVEVESRHGRRHPRRGAQGARPHDCRHGNGRRLI